jgi:hypothetical protein
MVSADVGRDDLGDVRLHSVCLFEALAASSKHKADDRMQS